MRIPLIILLAAAAACNGGRGSLSSGLDMSCLDWEHGRSLQWGFKYCIGLEVFDDLFLGARATIPVPSLVIIGNQVSYGVETAWLPVHPMEGFAVRVSASALRFHMWPEHVIVILVDGDTPEPPPEYPYETAEGFGLQVLLSPGYAWKNLALWLDLGIDHRVMEVERMVEGRMTGGDHDFTGPCFGLGFGLFL
ncbi:MAG: hypothetical protein AVO35_09745 [Candidatus Aegiribacteria sp. MLS_C]|nr:MAG: hypothetical protein AVO35_09745 [Candidatus Aegiribacteria sp. MLS_C]